MRSLRDNLYIINVPYRWRKNGVTSTSKVPLVHRDSEFPDISAVFLSWHVRTTVKKAKETLDHFYEAIKAVSFGIDVPLRKIIIH